jgi:hypothetical protein
VTRRLNRSHDTRQWYCVATSQAQQATMLACRCGFTSIVCNLSRDRYIVIVNEPVSTTHTKSPLSNPVSTARKIHDVETKLLYLSPLTSHVIRTVLGCASPGCSERICSTVASVGSIVGTSSFSFSSASFSSSPARCALRERIGGNMHFGSYFHLPYHVFNNV